MLIEIDPLPNDDVLFSQRAVGHGDGLIIFDTALPGYDVTGSTTIGKVLRIDRSAAEVIRAVFIIFPLDTFIDESAARMEVVGEPEKILPVMEEVQAELAREGGPAKILQIERFDFCERAKKAFAVIHTNKRRFYGCFALRKFVSPPVEA